MFFTIRFITAWIIWLIFADKSRMKELFPVAFFASFLGLTSDLLVLHVYELWAYHDTSFILSYLTDDWGVYLVTAYLFFQWLPKVRTTKNLLIYWFSWTTFAFVIEWIHLKQGVMTHHNGWNLGWSYVTGWFLFYIQYRFYCFTNDRPIHTPSQSTCTKIMEYSPHPVISVDRSSRVTFWNKSAEKVFGWTKSEVIGMSLPIIPKSQQSVYKERVHAKLTGQELYNTTITLVTKEGLLIKVRYDAYPTYNSQKEIIGSIAIFKEYTLLPLENNQESKLL